MGKAAAREAPEPGLKDKGRRARGSPRETAVAETLSNNYSASLRGTGGGRQGDLDSLGSLWAQAGAVAVKREKHGQI